MPPRRLLVRLPPLFSVIFNGKCPFSVLVMKEKPAEAASQSDGEDSVAYRDARAIAERCNHTSNLRLLVLSGSV